MSQKPSIVVVDDEADILELYGSILGEDYEVTSFNSPKAFLEALSSNKISTIDLLVTDLKMPGIDGLEMVRQAQQANFFFPFILLSGYLDKQAVIDAVDVGVFRLLEKPTEFEVLLATIDQLLMEHEVHKVRKEVRGLTSQLRELYTMVRMIMSQHIPQEIMDRLVVDTDEKGNVKQKMSFDTLLERLENRLDKLLESEKLLTELKTNKFK